MSSSSDSKVHQRRASDRLARLARLRWGAATVIGVVLFVTVLGAYWWYTDRDPTRDGAPDWSPDSQSIVFAAEIGVGKGDLYMMDADGSHRRQLTDTPAAEESPAMSPDGSHVAFESDRDGNSEIYVMDLPSRRVRRLTKDPARDLAPAWSPDGARIAFMSDRHNRASTDIYTMKADGSDVQQLTGNLSNWAPQYSPDGRELAYQVDRDVFVMDLATRAVRRLTFDPQNGMNPTWSPDGTRIAFVTTRGQHKAEIYVMNADGTNQHVLVSMAIGDAIDPRWSPDGRKVAFVLVPPSGDAAAPPDLQAIYTVDIASGRVTRISP